MLGGRVKRLAPLVACGVLMLGASGCEITDDGDNLVAGKQAFIESCGSCHTLARAGTTGVTGPNLDEAFQQARADGLGESTFEGMVYRQIQIPARHPQTDPQTGEVLSDMPADLVEGETAEDVAAYVASAVGKPGEDQGALARVGVERSTEVAEAENGTLAIPADPDGALAYVFGAAIAEPGPLDITSENEAQIDHNIALEGNGVDAVGPVVNNGGVSEISVDLQPGEYTFYCSVPGHREGGMEGPLTVE